MNSAANTKVVQDIYAAFGRGDLPAMLGMLAEDVRWFFPRGEVIPWGGERRGRDGVTQFFAALLQQVDFELFEPRSFVAEGERVLVTGAERMRVKATGRTCAVEWVHAFTLRDGRVTEFREYTDTAAIEAALGRG
jgi:ketosteroid isomerase-like protein